MLFIQSSCDIYRTTIVTFFIICQVDGGTNFSMHLVGDKNTSKIINKSQQFSFIKFHRHNRPSNIKMG